MKKYMQITAGRGPVECARAVTKVAEEFSRYCNALIKSGILTIDLVDSEPHNNSQGCYMSMTLSISGKDIPEMIIRDWEGSVQWIASHNPYRPDHKRKNWFVGVHFFDEVELPAITETDIAYETCRSGGKGGQNVNKVETTVRANHIPSGLSVRCSDQRSQSQNKALARERLVLKLRMLNENLLANSQTEQWLNHNALERGNPVRIFRGAL